MNSPNVRLRVVLTGPESSGKTTLARELANHLGCNLVPEFARSYLNALYRDYTYGDLALIARGQHAWEQWFHWQTKHKLLVCDTDWTVIRVWEMVKFGSTRYTSDKVSSSDTLYLLCKPDIAWEPDPLRENPGNRDELFGLYEDLLIETGASYVISTGNLTDRLQNALSVIEKYS